MEFKEWEPLYKEILSEFGYSEVKDRISAEFLADERGTDGLSPLRVLGKQEVEIIGPYNTASDKRLNIIAGSSLEQAVDKGVEPDLIVTDLDGDTKLQLEMNLKGVPIVMHAHGDNINLLNKWSSKFKGHVISTCQCKPPDESICNFGGFTDGDRAAFIADHFGAKKIILNGWDFENPYHEGKTKRKKLLWAKKLLPHLKTPVVNLS